MSNEICQDINPDCIVIACCSKPCDSLKWRIESKLMRIGSRDLFNFYEVHILNTKTCPRCNREEIILRTNYGSIEIKCTFCERIFVYHMDHNNEWFINSVGISRLSKSIGHYNKWSNVFHLINQRRLLHEHL